MQTLIESYEYENLRTFYVSVGKNDLNKKEMATSKAIRKENIAPEEFEYLLQNAKRLEFKYLYLPYNFYSHPKFQTLISIIKNYNFLPIFEATSQNLSLVVHESKKFFEKQSTIFNLVIQKEEDLVKTQEFHDLKNLQISIFYSTVEDLKNIFKKLNTFQIKKIHLLNLEKINGDFIIFDKVFKIANTKGIEIAKSSHLELDFSKKDNVDLLSKLSIESFGCFKKVKASVVINAIFDFIQFRNTINNILKQTIPADFFEIVIVLDGETLTLKNKIEELIKVYNDRIPFKLIFMGWQGNQKDIQKNVLLKNVGLFYSQGEKIIFINSGTIVGPQLIEEMIIKLNYWDILQFETIYYAPNILNKNQIEYTDLLNLDKSNNRNEPPNSIFFLENKKEPWEMISSNVLAIAKKNFEREGGFRMALGVSGLENVDLGLRSAKRLSLHKSKSLVFEPENESSFIDINKAFEKKILNSENVSKLFYFNPNIMLVEFLKTKCLNSNQQFFLESIKKAIGFYTQSN